MSPAKGDHPPPTSPGKRKDRDESAKKAKEPKKAKEAEGEKSKKASHRPTGHTKNSLEDAKKTELLNKVIAEVFELRNEVRDLKDTLQEVLKLVHKMDGTVGKAIGEDKWEEVEVRLALSILSTHFHSAEKASCGHQTRGRCQTPRGLGEQQEEGPRRVGARSQVGDGSGQVCDRLQAQTARYSPRHPQ